MIVWGRGLLNCDILIRLKLITRVTNSALLIKRKNKLVGCCCTCLTSGETVEHLLLHCSVAFKLWSFFFSFIQWVLTKIQHRPFIWLAESSRHVFFIYLKFGLVIFDVDIKARTNYRTYKWMFKMCVKHPRTFRPQFTNYQFKLIVKQCMCGIWK